LANLDRYVILIAEEEDKHMSKKTKAPVVDLAPRRQQPKFISHNGNPENGDYGEFYRYLRATGQLTKKNNQRT
jgi:hypothetical protein